MFQLETLKIIFKNRTQISQPSLQEKRLNNLISYFGEKVGGWGMGRTVYCPGFSLGIIPLSCGFADLESPRAEQVEKLGPRCVIAEEPQDLRS